MAAALDWDLWYLKKQKTFATKFQARISNILKYFIYETINTQENGSIGTHFAKILISNFLKGLTYSALFNQIDLHFIWFSISQ